MYEEFTTFIIRLITINICLKRDFILELIDGFDVDVEKLNYPDNNLDKLSISLNFYRSFNLDYYNIINHGITNKDVIISSGVNSHVNTKSSKTYIKLMGNDGDVITIVHELAHYIDRVSNPHIVPDK